MDDDIMDLESNSSSNSLKSEEEDTSLNPENLLSQERGYTKPKTKTIS